MKALIIDDDTDLASALVGELRSHGYEVEVANNGLEAIKTLAEGFTPTVILSDHDMPLMTGSEFYRQLHPSLEPRFILMSGGDRPKVFAAQHGIPFLSKPFDYDALDAAIRSTLP